MDDSVCAATASFGSGGRGVTTRILQIEFEGKVRTIDRQTPAASASLGPQLQQDIQSLIWTLGETIRQRAAAYFPVDYTLFIHVDLDDHNGRTRVVFWIATPNLSWSAGLLARRSWRMLAPVLQHVILQVVQEQMDGYTVDLDPKLTRVDAFAPRRALTDPLILAVYGSLLVTGYWLYLHPLARGWLNFL
jgi:hypothetical protein